jgi:hypothetical protein
MARKGRPKPPNSGRKAFQPTDEQRHMVRMLAGMARISQGEMALLFRNPHTGEPFSTNSFVRLFRRELQDGRVALKALITSKWHEALNAGAPWAIRCGLRNNLGYVLEGSQPIPVLDERSAMERALNVTFVVPPPEQLPAPPVVDITPEQKPDYAKPALEPPKGQDIPTPWGARWRVESDRNGWMK